MNENQLYWCIEPSIESIGYGYYDKVEPWLGKLEKSDTKVWWLYVIDENGIPDRDSDASTPVRQENIFETEQQAWEAYIDWFRKDIEYRQEQIYKDKDKLHQIEKDRSMN